MLVPLAVLALGAAFAGVAFRSRFIGGGYEGFWRHSLFVGRANDDPRGDGDGADRWSRFSPTLMMLVGLAVAYYMYVVERTRRSDSPTLTRCLYRFLLNKWYFDELYDLIFVRPAFAIGRLFWKGGDGRDHRRLRAGRRLRPRARRDPQRGPAADRLHLPLRLRDAARRRGARDLVPVRGGSLMSGSWILSGLLVLPLVGALFILLLPGETEATKRNARWIALFATLITFVLSLVAWGRFDTSQPASS